MFFFFFSSRRRHTRFDCDWSSDVCSSDLVRQGRYSFGRKSAAHSKVRGEADYVPKKNSTGRIGVSRFRKGWDEPAKAALPGAVAGSTTDAANIPASAN